MNALLAFATALTRAWTAAYTRGLPADLRAARREEIDCDLWHHQRLAELEQAPAAGTGLQITARLFLGMPADISWRIEAGSAARPGRGNQMNESWAIRGLLALALAVAAFPAVIGFLVAIGVNGEWGGTGERVLWGTVQMTIGIAIISGLALSARRPGLGIGLVVAGGIAISALWYWAAMITVPVGLLLIGLAYSRARRTAWRSI